MNCDGASAHLQHLCWRMEQQLYTSQPAFCSVCDCVGYISILKHITPDLS